MTDIETIIKYSLLRMPVEQVAVQTGLLSNPQQVTQYFRCLFLEGLLYGFL